MNTLILKMTRKQFIKLSTLAGITLSVHPLFAFQNEKTLTYDELIGKGLPKLYGNGYKLKLEVHLAFLNMQKEAQKSDVSIKIVSSYRSFKHQNDIWQRKFKTYISTGMTPKNAIDKIIEYSTIPGTSRHHWGTEIDIIDTNANQPKQVLAPSNFGPIGPYYPLKQWMDVHANSFGFYLVYTNLPKRKGFKYEPWHYSYKPLSSNYLKAYRNLDLNQLVKNEALLGGEYFTNAFTDSYLNENLLDINPELL